MAITDFTFFKTQDTILAEMLAQLQAAIADAWTSEDGITYIIFNIEANQLETLYLANQLLLEDMFISSASSQALQRHGADYGILLKDGTFSTGTLMFSGDGGTYVPVGTEVGYDPGNGLDVIYFNTTSEGTIPNPGIPTAPTLADVGGTGGLADGLYEYAVSFVTASGETLISDPSNAISVTGGHHIRVTVPIGGAGTTARRIYRRLNGGAWAHVTGADSTLNNNTTTMFDDVNATASGSEPTIDTAHSVTVDGLSQDPGANTNVGVGTITVLTNAPATLITVTNPTAFVGGSDPEDTETYRRRLLQWVQNPQTGSPNDLKAWAEAVPGVETATVFSNTPAAGEVTVRVSGPGGTIPITSVLDDVAAALAEQDLANVVIHVSAFTAVSTNVTVDVTTSGTYTLADITASVQAAISDYINSLEIGGTLYLSGIVDSVFGLPGIADVVVTTPASNQTTAADSKRTPGTITVT